MRAYQSASHRAHTATQDGSACFDCGGTAWSAATGGGWDRAPAGTGTAEAGVWAPLRGVSGEARAARSAIRTSAVPGPTKIAATARKPSTRRPTRSIRLALASVLCRLGLDDHAALAAAADVADGVPLHVRVAPDLRHPPEIRGRHEHDHPH